MLPLFARTNAKPRRSRVAPWLGLLCLASWTGCTGGFVGKEGAVDAELGGEASTAPVPYKALHRLSGLDYDNSLHDLTGTQLHFAPALPADGTIDNFDNGAETASLSPAWLDMFVQAAVEVGDEVTASAADATRAEAMYFKVAPCAKTQAKGCLAATAAAFGRRAWRRPLSPDEVAALVASASAAGTDLPTQVGTLVSTALASPHFLFRIEADAPGGRGAHAVSAYELATRLSYFLWRSTPDDALLAAAANKSLLQPTVLSAQVERMLGDPRAQSLITGFGEQWLFLDHFPQRTPDAETFPGFDAKVRASMAAETRLYLNDFLLGQKPLSQILTSRYTYLDDTAAAWYGLTKPNATSPIRVNLDPSSARHGILTHGSMLITGSTGATPSPVRRGKLIMDRFLCAAPAAPPAGATNELTGDRVGKTNRQLFSEHTQNPACASCHVAMDDFGFAFENFDAAARVRSTDNDLPVDTTGKYLGTTAFADSQQMTELLAKDPQIDPCFTKLLLTYALGRATEPADAATLEQLAADFAADQENVRHLIGQIVLSRPFRYRSPQ